MKKHLKKQFSGLTAPIVIILGAVYKYYITSDIIEVLALVMQMALFTIGLYIYGAVCAHKAEADTRLEYEPEEPEV